MKKTTNEITWQGAERAVIPEPKVGDLFMTKEQHKTLIESLGSFEYNKIWNVVHILESLPKVK